MTRFKSIVSDIDGTLRNNVESVAPPLDMDKRGSHVYAALLFNCMHIFKGFSTKKILRIEAEWTNGKQASEAVALEEEGINVLKKYQEISKVRTRNNFRDLDMIKEAIRESGANISVDRVINNDMLHGIEGKALLLQDNPVSALRDILRHKDAEAIIVPRYYNDFVGGIISKISKRVHMVPWKDIDRYISEHV